MDLVDVEIFHWISENFDLLESKENTGDHQGQQDSSSVDNDPIFMAI